MSKAQKLIGVPVMAFATLSHFQKVCAQQSVHLTGGILRDFQALSTLKQNPALEVLSTSAHPQVTHTVRLSLYSFLGNEMLMMRYLLSPNHFADQFKNGWTFSDKVDVFEARIQGWQLDVAWNLAKLDIQNNQIAIIHLVSSYFEMIGKYIEGFLEDGSSQRYFKIGLRNVFPDLGEQEEIFMKSIYRNLRCGLYHLGRPAANVILNDDAPGAIGYNEENGLIMISPTKLLGDIQANFNAYMKGLRHTSNPHLRENFEARFDHDNRFVISPENGSA